ncbi:MAG: FKBP-type peptidyl-prolyl cis-trans isomerase, partial [Candidatus Aenigmarchaeota archaeon]|nr:FKBP-type peptidyl-prolyl cis-trans isomerase [Candidatus Aenigmarchaeota archaeon]MDW8149564.1 FKBP-type peptidyl-prolyl cis-trans isomerase [Candidatus Aenigmarchaeota archaeon]
MQRKGEKMNTGDFVYIDYVGRIKDTGEIFDLTKEDLAKKEGIYKPEIKYKPIPIIVDAKFILSGLNKALKEMKVGEKR